MVRLEIDQHRDVARELVHVLELERRELADDPGRVADGGEWSPYVARDDDIAPGGPEDRSEQLRRRRLAVRAGDADEACLREQPVAQLDLRPHLDPALVGCRDERRLAWDAR